MQAITQHRFVIRALARKLATAASSGSAATATVPSPPTATAAVFRASASAALPNLHPGRSCPLFARSDPVPESAPPAAIMAQDVQAAFSRVRSYVARTPLDYSARISAMTGGSIFLKKEHLSVTGAYKERGAVNKLLSLTAEQRRAGVVAASAGNHAQAVSYHATRLGIDAVIVMPEITPHVKVQATRNFGAKVVIAGRGFADAAKAAAEIAQKEKRTFVHAFNDPLIMAGQGTIGIELLEQNPFLDAVIVPVGGGGLIAGISTLIKHVNPRIKVYGVNAHAMPGMLSCYRAGQVVDVKRNDTMAEGVAVERVGDLTFATARRMIDGMCSADESEIAHAILVLLEAEKTAVEGAGAVALAALLSNKLPESAIRGKQVAVVLSGGNIDMSLLGRVIDKGLVKSGRLARFRLSVADSPGELLRVLQIVADTRANIREIEHERAFASVGVKFTQPIVTVETRDHAHITELLAKLHSAGYKKVVLETPQPDSSSSADGSD